MITNIFRKQPKLFPFKYDDGGRVAAGYRGSAGDCVTRATAIASGMDYQTVYDEINKFVEIVEGTLDSANRSSARKGIFKPTTRAFLEDQGWTWTPTMFIGSGCKVHLVPHELPNVDTLIAKVSRHIVAVVDGTIRDTGNPSRGGTRCVYGYWTR